MEIKEIVDSILLEKNIETNILEIFRTGSQLFRTNPSDIDIVVICEDIGLQYWRTAKYIDNIHYDFIFRGPDSYQVLLDTDWENKSEDIKNGMLYNYFVCFREKIYGNWDFTWNMLEYKKEYFAYLKYQYIKTIGKRRNRTKLTKGWVQYYIILKIYENNKIEITPEMKTDINLLYNSHNNEQESIVKWIDTQIQNI